MEEIPTVATDWLKYRLLADTTQQHCVCAGHHRDVKQTPVAMETASVVNDSDSLLVKERSSTPDQSVDRHSEDKNCNTTADKNPSDLQNLGNSNETCSKTSSYNNSASTDHKSQTHSCAKRLKISNKSQVMACDNGNAESLHAKCAAPDSADTEENEVCLENIGFNMRQEQNQENLEPCLNLSNFLEDNKDMDYFKAYVLPDNMLQHFIVMDIISPCSRKSICFTKGYGKFVTGTGSVVQMTKNIQMIKQASVLKDQAVSNRDQIQWSESELSIIRSLQLRYCTPREVANILCFPKSFSLPDSLTNRQLYMLLGNSLNVHVVSVLIQLMVTETD